MKYPVNPEQEGKPVKYILKEKLGLSERFVKKLKFAGRILLNGQSVHINVPVHAGDLVEALLSFEEETDHIIPQDLPLEILYEDEGLLAVNKQPHIVVHPTSTHPAGTVANAVMYHYLQNDQRLKIRPVSRLDRDTSGIILFAKNPFIQETLIRQMEEKTFHKSYIGIVAGQLVPAAGTLDLPIDRKPDSIMLRHVSATGQPSVTHYNTLEVLNGASLVEFQLETGRTHQIRVHCQSVGHPLVGDTLYSEQISPYIDRQALHSLRAAFVNPSTGKQMELKAPLPPDIAALLEILRK